MCGVIRCDIMCGVGRHDRMWGMIYSTMYLMLYDKMCSMVRYMIRDG